MMSVTKKTATAATLAYVERVLRYFASLRYFLDRLDRLLALVSRAEGEKSQCGYSVWTFGVTTLINSGS